MPPASGALSALAYSVPIMPRAMPWRASARVVAHTPRLGLLRHRRGRRRVWRL